MAPDASKRRQGSAACGDVDEHSIKQSTDSIECILREPARRVLTDFSYMEQPMRCNLTCRGKRLSCIGKNASYMTDPNDHSALDEFALFPQPDGSVLLQNTKSTRYICSSASGEVYASSPECCNEEKNKWILTELHQEGEIVYYITSVASHCNLACSGSNAIHTIENDTGDNSMLWTIDLTSGELCFLSMPYMDRRVRCDIVGTLSLSKNFLGWEAWRLSEAGNGHVRISPWAHAGMFLSSDDQGHVVCATASQQKQRGGSSQLWKVEKAPGRLAAGVIISSVPNGRVLSYRYVEKEGSFCTIPGCRSALDESCVWDFESLHRQTYYLITSGNHGSNRRLEAAKKGLGTRGLPGRISSEEWRVEFTKDEDGVVTLFSSARTAYLGSNRSGEVFLTAEPDGAAKWVIEERDEGFVVSSHASQRVLVSPRRGPISTVEPGTMVVGTARWKLEPKIPRQVSKEKMQAVGAAVAIGVVGTVATPFLIGGAIGAIGIANVGIAGNVAIGSIRAAEALSTITRITKSSSELMRSQSSFLSTDSAREQENNSNNRPFCNWRSW